MPPRTRRSRHPSSEGSSSRSGVRSPRGVLEKSASITEVPVTDNLALRIGRPSGLDLASAARLGQASKGLHDKIIPAMNESAMGQLTRSCNDTLKTFSTTWVLSSATMDQLRFSFTEMIDHLQNHNHAWLFIDRPFEPRQVQMLMQPIIFFEGLNHQNQQLSISISYDGPYHQKSGQLDALDVNTLVEVCTLKWVRRLDCPNILFKKLDGVCYFRFIAKDLNGCKIQPILSLPLKALVFMEYQTIYNSLATRLATHIRESRVLEVLIFYHSYLENEDFFYTEIASAIKDSAAPLSLVLVEDGIVLDDDEESPFHRIASALASRQDLQGSYLEKAWKSVTFSKDVLSFDPYAYETLRYIN